MGKKKSKEPVEKWIEVEEEVRQQRYLVFAMISFIVFIISLGNFIISLKVTLEGILEFIHMVNFLIVLVSGVGTLALLYGYFFEKEEEWVTKKVRC